MSRILCVFPDDYSTKFLNRLQFYLKKQFPDQFHCFKIKPERASHISCLERIQTNRAEELIIYLGHGGSDYVFGATSQTEVFRESEGLYGDAYAQFSEERFISRDNVGILSGKRVICVSCDSAVALGQLACDNGAKVFLGFLDIPTSFSEFDLDDHRLPLARIIAAFKGELVWIIKTAVRQAIQRNSSFEELCGNIKILTSFRIQKIRQDRPGIRRSDILVDTLADFRNGARVFGDKKLRLFD